MIFSAVKYIFGIHLSWTIDFLFFSFSVQYELRSNHISILILFINTWIRVQELSSKLFTIALIFVFNYRLMIYPLEAIWQCVQALMLKTEVVFISMYWSEFYILAIILFWSNSLFLFFVSLFLFCWILSIKILVIDLIKSNWGCPFYRTVIWSGPNSTMNGFRT